MLSSRGISHSVQSLWRDKNFTVTVILTMAAACSVFLAVLTLIWQLLLQPLPYPAAEQLHLLQYQRLDGNGKLQSSSLLQPAAEQLYQLKQQWQQPTQQPPAEPLPQIELALIQQGQDVVMSDPAQPRLSSAYISPEVGRMLGMRLILGGGFNQAHQLQQNNPGVLLSYQAWQLLFQQRPDVLQQRLQINGVSHPVLGVLAADFVPPPLNPAVPPPDLWLPWDFNNGDFKGSWHFPDVSTTVLLKGTPQQLDRWLTALAAPAAQQFTNQVSNEANFAHWQVRLDKLPLQQHVSQQHQGLLILLLIGASGLLLIATTNILNLFLARLLLLQKQLAIRAALGARRAQLAQQLFGEAMLLMLLASGCGVLLAHLGLTAFQHWASGSLARSVQPQLSLFSIVSALLLAALLALLITWLSARTVQYHQLRLALQSGNKGAGIQIPTLFRRGFILLQLCCAIVLVFLSTLVVRDAYAKLTRPLGITTDQVLQVEFAVSTLDWQGWSNYAPNVAEMASRLRQHPAIADVSFAYNPLLDRFQLAATDLSNDRRFYPVHRNVDAHYFSLLGQTLLAGSYFRDQDVGRQQQPKIIVNETFARQLLLAGAAGDAANEQPDWQQVIGRQIKLDMQQQPFQVIGVVTDLQLPGLAVTPPRFYMTNLGTALWMLIKLKPATTFSKTDMVAALQQAHSQFALTQFSSLAELTDRLYLPQRLMLGGALLLALFTMLISVIGLIGVMQYNQQLRHSEFCIRLALGARFQHILRESGSEYLHLLLAAILISLGVLFGLWLAYQTAPALSVELLASKLSLQARSWWWHPLFLYGFTLMLVLKCAAIAHYLPLRRLYKTAISQGMRGSR